jgi:PAS domain S-box-containing protein
LPAKSFETEKGVRVLQSKLGSYDATQITKGLLSQAVNSSSCGITVSNATQPDMPLVYVNQSFEKMTGYGWSEVKGRNCRFLQGDEAQAESTSAIRQAIKNQTECTEVLKNYKKTGEMFYNELHLSPLRNEQGEVSHYVGIQTDVTARVQQNHTLAAYQSQLEQLVAVRTQEIQHKNIALQELVSQVELERRRLKGNITANVDTVLMPLIKKLRSKCQPKDRELIDIVGQQLLQLTDPFGNNIARSSFALSPKEREVCTLITHGMRTKEIAALFNVALSTVENQRNTIRKKLGIAGKAINLSTYLLSLTQDQDLMPFESKY